MTQNKSTGECQRSLINNRIVSAIVYRHMLYTGLVYGAKYFGVFSREYTYNKGDRLSEVLSPSVWNGEGSKCRVTYDKNELYDEMSSLHKKVLGHDKTLMSLTHMNTYHYSDDSFHPNAPKGLKDSIPSHSMWHQLIYDDIAQRHFDLLKYLSPKDSIDPLVLSFLVNGRDDYFWIFNKSIEKELKFGLYFNQQKNLQNVLDEKDYSRIDNIEVVLLPGEAKLFKVQNTVLSNVNSENTETSDALPSIRFKSSKNKLVVKFSKEEYPNSFSLYKGEQEPILNIVDVNQRKYKVYCEGIEQGTYVLQFDYDGKKLFEEIIK